MAPPRKYLQVDEWEKWKGNDWLHYCKKITALEARQYIIIVLTIGIFIKLFVG